VQLAVAFAIAQAPGAGDRDLRSPFPSRLRTATFTHHGPLLSSKYCAHRLQRWFSVSKSNVDPVSGYIDRQKEHHRSRGFKDEFLRLLEKHEVEYDERYVWD
jgi:hypothetical protein